jgi:hypothetical protein
MAADARDSHAIAPRALSAAFFFANKPPIQIASKAQLDSGDHRDNILFTFMT